MNAQHTYDLKDVIDLQSLQDIQDRYAKIMKVASITVDENGIPVVHPSNFTKFCNLIRSTKLGFDRCMKSDAYGGFNAMKAGQPIVYHCHSGLTDVAAPIIVNGNYMGCMLCGQVMINNIDYSKHINLIKLSRELGLSKEDLEAALKEIPKVKYNEIKDAADFLYLFANFIAKMGVANIAQSELVEEMKKRMDLERLLNDMELKALQSQINPHFLFNTLNTIARMAMIEDAPNTEELIYNLSDLLRYSLNNINRLVDIETEINNIKKYLFIQTTRYGDRITYEINIEPSILKCKIPVMTLQPIVENAIIHGLEPKKDGGKIIITGKKVDDKNIMIEITDNGIGIDENKLYDLTKTPENNPEYSTGLGMQNVRSRIKHCFGKEYGVDINSSYMQGTSVYITIPYQSYMQSEVV